MSDSEVWGAANAANRGHDAAAAKKVDPVLHIQQFKPFVQAQQSDPVLQAQQCQECSKGHDAAAAKMAHAVNATNPTGRCC